MRILFYADWLVALPYLLPLYEYLKEKQPDWHLYFSGSSEKVLEDIVDRGLPWRDQGEAYDFAFTCDEQSACYQHPKGTKVCIFHGLASKGQAWSTSRIGIFVNYPGLFVVPSRYYRKLLIALGVDRDKIIVGGLTKYDFVKEIPALRENPRILYAPTHNPPLSALEIIDAKDILTLPNLHIHLHEYTATGDKPHHKALRAGLPEFSHGDLAPKIVESDIVIGDCGSAVLEAIALGKYAIQVINSHLGRHYCEVQGISPYEMIHFPEFAVTRNYARQVYDFDELDAAISAYPREREYAQHNNVLVEHIGHSCETIYEKVLCR